ncbi:MAG: zf-HC2 domain-containing protein [Pyrinomonadaceae bacterium]
MNNTGQTNSRQLQIQGLLDRCLQARAIADNANAKVGHLDEDSISAFVDGSLLEKEAAPIISHLAECSFCRHISSELIKLDLAFADVPKVRVETPAEPTKVSEVLSGIMAKIFGTNDSEVFAHHEKDDEEKAEGEPKD